MSLESDGDAAKAPFDDFARFKIYELIFQLRKGPRSIYASTGADVHDLCDDDEIRLLRHLYD
jgi:hypothetical protein